MKKLWPYYVSVVSVMFAFALAVYAAGVWVLVTGSNCGTSGDNRCVSKAGVTSETYSAVYPRDADGAKLWDGSTSALFDFTNYASPYALYGDKGLGDWPEFDGQVVGYSEADLCDGKTLSECLAEDGVVIHICAYYPGGVYQQFELMTCVEAEAGGGGGEVSTTSSNLVVDAFDIFMLTSFRMLFLAFIAFAAIGFVISLMFKPWR